jgi:hypothetical protein
MTANGPSRRFAAAQQLGRFWREADINRQAEPAGLVANDLTRTLGPSRTSAIFLLNRQFDFPGRGAS